MKASMCTQSISGFARHNRCLQDLIRVICQAEAVITRAQSLLSKFTLELGESDLPMTELRNFVSDLLELPEVNVVGAPRAPLGSVVHRMFVNSQKVRLTYCVRYSCCIQ